jgi:hypothetical protein
LINRFLLYIVYSILFVFSGCASYESPRDFSNLSKPYKVATLSEDIEYTFDGSFGRASVTLVAGKYKLQFSDPRGKYWIPDHPAVAGKAGDGVYVRFGGLWIPNSTEAAPRVFYYGFSQRYLVSGTTIKSALLPWTSVPDDEETINTKESLYELYEGAHPKKVVLRPDQQNPPIFFSPPNGIDFKEKLAKHFSIE